MYKSKVMRSCRPTAEGDRMSVHGSGSSCSSVSGMSRHMGEGTSTTKASETGGRSRPEGVWSLLWQLGPVLQQIGSLLVCTGRQVEGGTAPGCALSIRLHGSAGGMCIGLGCLSGRLLAGTPNLSGDCEIPRLRERPRGGRPTALHAPASARALSHSLPASSTMAIWCGGLPCQSRLASVTCLHMRPAGVLV